MTNEFSCICRLNDLGEVYKGMYNFESNTIYGFPEFFTGLDFREVYDTEIEWNPIPVRYMEDMYAVMHKYKGVLAVFSYCNCYYVTVFKDKYMIIDRDFKIVRPAIKFSEDKILGGLEIREFARAKSKLTTLAALQPMLKLSVATTEDNSKFVLTRYGKLGVSREIDGCQICDYNYKAILQESDTGRKVIGYTKYKNEIRLLEFDKDERIIRLGGKVC